MRNEIQILLYIGDTLVGDLNKLAKNRHLDESLKSESNGTVADQFTFDINRKQFKDFIATKFDDDYMSFLRVGKTSIVVVVDKMPRFSGFLSARPARSGPGAEQMLSLTFYEHFARLSGDVVCDPNNKESPLRIFTNRPTHLYVQDLITEFMARAAESGEVLNWTFGVVDQLANKSMTYDDFQTISKALSDAMDNTQGAGKFDVVFRVDPEDYKHHFIDILKPRGSDKNIIIQYPSDGVYKLWSSSYEVPETNDYASEVIVAGNGEVGNPDAGEDTAEIASAANEDFVQEFCYWRVYETQSNLKTLQAVTEYAEKSVTQKDFNRETPVIRLVGRPIAWGSTSDDNNGLAVGDSFYFEETNDDGGDLSDYYRIIGLSTDWDDNGVATVEPTLMRVD